MFRRMAVGIAIERDGQPEIVDSRDRREGDRVHIEGETEDHWMKEDKP